MRYRRATPGRTTPLPSPVTVTLRFSLVLPNQVSAWADGTWTIAASAAKGSIRSVLLIGAVDRAAAPTVSRRARGADVRIRPPSATVDAGSLPAGRSRRRLSAA